MKILLINPPNCGRSIPEERFGITSIKQIFRGEPLALETLAGNLDGHEVAILDLKVEPENLDPTLAEFQPELVGITAVTCEANAACRIARAVKAATSAKTVVGGIHASSDPEFFNRPEIDYVVIGIGKASFRELVDELELGKEARLPGVAKTSPGQTLTFTPRKFSSLDLVEDKPPRYDLVSGNRGHYTLLGLPLGFVTSAFGCPFDCNFCCITNQSGGKYLACAIQSVIRDIGLLGEVPFIRMVDANTFGNPEHARQLCRALQAAGIKKDFFGDVRSDTVVRYPELMQEWRDAGLRTVVIGFEEITDAGLSAMNKANGVAENREAIKILRGMGITIVGDFIVSPDYDHAD
ncbi:MAG: cobalamin-dependent protein, partial [Holophaga sp.]|nr:cobalamin-dependent protein [Holophaga sp.]